jgi:hypothetical protein
MEAVSEVRKGKGIEEVLGSHSEQSVDSDRKVEVVDESLLPSLLERHKQLLDMARYLIDIDLPNCIRNGPNGDGVKFMFTDVLTPSMINAFLQATLVHETHREYGELTGPVISRLIQNSYEAGHNRFVLDTRTLPELVSIGEDLKGTKDRKLELMVFGDGGYSCGMGAEHLNMTVEGCVNDDCGENSRYSTFNISGDAGRYCGSRAYRSTFVIYGTSIGLALFIQNAPKRCTFKTPHEEVSLMLKACLPEGNRVILMHPEGKEEKVRGYGRKK